MIYVHRKAEAVQCLQDIVDVARKSSVTAKILEPVVVGQPESPVPTYRWQQYT